MDAKDMAALIDRLETTDAQVWAQEWCKMFSVLPKVGGIPAHEIAHEWAEGLMIGWFANAIERGRTAGYHQAMAEMRQR